MARSRGDGSFKRLLDGRWVYQVSLGVDDSGKRARPRFYGATQAECREQAEDYRVKLRSGLNPHRDESMTAYMTRWLAEREHALRPSTFRRYRQHVALDILPTLGRLDLDQVSRSHVVRMVAAIRARGRTVRTANHAKNVLGAALQDALRDGLVTQNVARLVKGLPSPRAEVSPLTPAEVERLRGAVQGTRREALYSLALTYGLRQGELLGLTWADVDFAAGVLHVRHALHYEGETYALGELKTRQSRRSLVMPAFISDVLSKHRTRQSIEREHAGAGWQAYWPDLVFRGTTGRPMNGPALTRSFHQLQDEIGIKPGRRWHDLRHQAATTLLAAGVDIKVIQQILGHSNIGTTADIYAHVIPALQTDAFERVRAMGER